MNNRKHFCCFIFYSILFYSCQKHFLDKKPNSSLVVPTTLNDFQALLDDYNTMNETGALGEISSDNYYLLSYPNWQALPVQERNAYIWKADLYEGVGNINDWNLSYKQIFYANIVLDGINNLETNSSNEIQYNLIKGWALFLRGFAYFNLSQLFSPAYDASTASSDLGLPLRLSANIDELKERSTVQETYDQIIDDLNHAIDLLPQAPLNSRNRPCKPAVYALLARVYLSMREYNKALENASNCLQVYNQLMDYNSTTSFNRLNIETLYQSNLSFGTSVLKSTSSNTIVDSNLYSSYSLNDLRKSRYFKYTGNLPRINLNYSGTIYPFSGLAIDEVFLIKAECLVRVDDVANAMSTLNMLLVKRYVTGSFSELKASNKDEALNTILNERRKELVFRGLRWIDLRRLNKENRSIIQKRELNGHAYLIQPNSQLYVLPIPPDEIRLSNIEQNPR